MRKGKQKRFDHRSGAIEIFDESARQLALNLPVKRQQARARIARFHGAAKSARFISRDVSLIECRNNLHVLSALSKYTSRCDARPFPAR